MKIENEYETCACGSKYKLKNKRDHLSSIKHRKYIMSPYVINPDDIDIRSDEEKESPQKYETCECGSKYKLMNKKDHIYCEKHRNFIANGIILKPRFCKLQKL